MFNTFYPIAWFGMAAAAILIIVMIWILVCDVLTTRQRDEILKERYYVFNLVTHNEHWKALFFFRDPVKLYNARLPANLAWFTTIETVPLDGTWVELATIIGQQLPKNVLVMRYSIEFEEWISPISGERWADIANGVPTHWRSIPDR